MDGIFLELNELHGSLSLPEHDDLLALVDTAISCLESEPASYRPPQKFDGEETGGGLLDFSAAPELPLIVVPDLHARCDFFMHLLQSPLGKLHVPCESDKTVLDALSLGHVRVVCVGDLFHSERRGMERWLSAWEKYEAGDYESPEMG